MHFSQSVSVINPFMGVKLPFLHSMETYSEAAQLIHSSQVSESSPQDTNYGLTWYCHANNYYEQRVTSAILLFKVQTTQSDYLHPLTCHLCSLQVCQKMKSKWNCHEESSLQDWCRNRYYFVSYILLCMKRSRIYHVPPMQRKHSNRTWSAQDFQ